MKTISLEMGEVKLCKHLPKGCVDKFYFLKFYNYYGFLSTAILVRVVVMNFKTNFVLNRKFQYFFSFFFLNIEG